MSSHSLQSQELTLLFLHELEKGVPQEPLTETLMFFSKESLARTVSSHLIFHHFIFLVLAEQGPLAWHPPISTLMILTSLQKMTTAKKSAEINSFRRLPQ